MWPFFLRTEFLPRTRLRSKEPSAALPSRTIGRRLSNLHLLVWVFYLIDEDRVRMLTLAPPCTTFSAAAYPALRNRACSPRLSTAAVLLKCWYARVAAVLEQPRSTSMCAVEEWKRLHAFKGFLGNVDFLLRFWEPRPEAVPFLVYVGRAL